MPSRQLVIEPAIFGLLKDGSNHDFGIAFTFLGFFQSDPKNHKIMIGKENDQIIQSYYDIFKKIDDPDTSKLFLSILDRNIKKMREFVYKGPDSIIEYLHAVATISGSELFLYEQTYCNLPLKLRNGECQIFNHKDYGYLYTTNIISQTSVGLFNYQKLTHV